MLETIWIIFIMIAMLMCQILRVLVQRLNAISTRTDKGRYNNQYNAHVSGSTVVWNEPNKSQVIEKQEKQEDLKEKDNNKKNIANLSRIIIRSNTKPMVRPKVIKKNTSTELDLMTVWTLTRKFTKESVTLTSGTPVFRIRNRDPIKGYGYTDNLKQIGSVSISGIDGNSSYMKSFMSNPKVRMYVNIYLEETNQPIITSWLCTADHSNSKITFTSNEVIKGKILEEKLKDHKFTEGRSYIFVLTVDSNDL